MEERTKLTRMGIVAELGHETRVAATPVTIKQLAGLGYDVVVEKVLGNQRPSVMSHMRSSGGAGLVRASTGRRPLGAWDGVIIPAPK